MNIDSTLAVWKVENHSGVSKNFKQFQLIIFSNYYRYHELIFVVKSLLFIIVKHKYHFYKNRELTYNPMIAPIYTPYF